jgi:hypothetical protein
MKAGMIFARKTTWRSRLDLEYLDETSSRKVSARPQHDDGPKTTRPLRQFADYASKETLGQVHAGGFLHHLILINEDASRTAPSQLTNDERKRRISEAWFEHIRKFPTSSQNPVIQHRLVFSMSREMHDKLVDAGINPDRVLQSTTQKIMGKFNERFHPADSIGFAYGIHHDTDNLHIHVALCPRTARGAYVGCSRARNPGSGHKDQMRFLRSCFERENKRWEQTLASPQELEEHLSRRLDSDKMVFSPRLNPSQMDALRNAQTAEAIRLQQLYSSIRNLEASITAKRKYFVLKRSVNFVSRLVGRHVPKTARVAEKLAAAVDRRSLREMRHLLFKIRVQYRAAHKRYAQMQGFSSYANRIAIAHRQQNALEFARTAFVLVCVTSRIAAYSVAIQRVKSDSLHPATSYNTLQEGNPCYYAALPWHPSSNARRPNFGRPPFAMRRAASIGAARARLTASAHKPSPNSSSASHSAKAIRSVCVRLSPNSSATSTARTFRF